MAAPERSHSLRTAGVSNLRLRTRLLIILILISGIGLAGMSVAVWGLTRNQLIERVDGDLKVGLSSWGLRPDTGRVETESNLPSQYLLVRMFPDGSSELKNPTGAIPDVNQFRYDRRPHTVTAAPNSLVDTTFRVIAVEAPDGTRTVVAKSLEAEKRMLEGLAAVLTSISILVLLMMGAAGTFFVRRALSPLKELEHTAMAIAEGDINRRAPAWSRNTEVGKLSYAMNTMVSRLQETLEESQQKEEQMRRFVGDASHELRTPLTSVRGYTELYRAGVTDDADMVLHKIDEESARMKLLVEDLLALTRAEGSRLNLREVDLLEIVLSVSSSARAAFPGRELTVSNHAEDIPIVSGDPDRLHQVILNLVSNGFKHGGPEAAVSITLRDYLDRVYIDIEDDGCGMDEKDAEHIFERFYRADASRNRSKSSGGSGLGLAITKSLVELHDGAISVQTSPGVGSKFTISLPKYQAGEN